MLNWYLDEELTRTDCQCIVCQVGHARNNQCVDVSEYTQKLYAESKNEINLCPKCFSNKQRGQYHKCSPVKESIHNLKQCIPKRLQEQFSASVIKEKMSASGSKETKLTTFGTPLSVSVGKETPEQKVFTHKDVIGMQRHMNLSDTKALKMAQDIRDICSNK